jgi:hypothetical protein
MSSLGHKLTPAHAEVGSKNRVKPIGIGIAILSMVLLGDLVEAIGAHDGLFSDWGRFVNRDQFDLGTLIIAIDHDQMSSCRSTLRDGVVPSLAPREGKNRCQ